jgi:hypothetical protein
MRLLIMERLIRLGTAWLKPGAPVVAWGLALSGLLLVATALRGLRRSALRRRGIDWALLSFGLAFLAQAALRRGHDLVGGVGHAAAAVAMTAHLARAWRRRGEQECDSAAGAPAGPPEGRGFPRIARAAALLLILLVVALPVRLHRLDEITPGVGNHSGFAAMRAVRGVGPLLHAGAWRLTPGTLHHTAYSPIYLGALAGSFSLWGVNLRALRMTDLLWSLVCLASFYLLLVRLGSPRAALLGVVVLVLSRWHIAYSRAGTFIMATITHGIWLLLVLEANLRRARAWTLGLAAVVLAGGSYFYAAVRPMVVLSAPLLLLLALRGPGSGRQRAGRLAALVAPLALLAAVQLQGVPDPRGTYFYQRPESPPDVAIWLRSVDGKDVLDHASLSAAVENLKKNIRFMAQFFYVDGSVGELFSVALLPGLLYLLARRRRAMSRVLVIWALAALSPGFLVKPVSRRLILIMPVLAASAALLLDRALDGFASWRRGPLPGVLAAALCVGLAPVMITDLAATFSNLRYKHLLDNSYGNPQVDRFGWLARELVGRKRLLIRNIGFDKPIFELLIYEASRATDGQPRHEQKPTAAIMRNLPDLGPDTAVGFLTGRSDLRFVERIQQVWPGATVIEGLPRRKAAADRPLFCFVWPPGEEPPEVDGGYFRWKPLRVEPIEACVERFRRTSPALKGRPAGAAGSRAPAGGSARNSPARR